ncbi:phage tail spike protein [Staphylospora marina]|uniref:phage tail spike protein n=1 Tax=Staphylospora marina TaxID=2490858 RepID=UPI000F5C1F2F|nr:phage tail spike protein [Staphylospora marina]
MNLFVLDQFERAVAVLNPSLPDGCPFFEDVRTERIEYAYLTFEFSVPGDHPTSQHLVVGNLIVYPVRPGVYNLFRIISTEDEHSEGQYTKRVICENAAVGDLVSNIILPASLPSYTLPQAINYLLQGTDWEAGEVELAGSQDIVFEDVATSLDALHQVMDKFGAEIEFVVEFNGLTITRRLVHARLQRGRALNKPFVYGLNLKGAKRKEDYTQLVTALYGIGPKDSDGNLMTFETYNPTLSDPYEKPSGAKWVGDKDALQRWSKNGKHIFGVFKDDSATNQVELFNNTLEELKKRNRPQLSYEVDVALLPEEDVRLYDTVIVKDTTFRPELILEARIVETRFSLTDPSKNQVILGDYRPVTLRNTEYLRELRSQLERNQDEAKRSAGTGLHVIADSPKPLSNDGDYWNAGNSLTIEVTENIHLWSVSVFCQTSGQSANIELRGPDDTVIEQKWFNNLSAGENRLPLGFLLRKDVGVYKLWGNFSGNTWRTVSGVEFPYDSGTFKVTGTSSPSGAWYHFYNLTIGGPGVKGAPGQEFRLGDSGNRLGKIQILDANEEPIFIADAQQTTVKKLVAGDVDAPTVVKLSTDATITYYVNPSTGDDDNDGLTTGTPLRSVRGAVDRIARVFDGTIVINVLGNLTEDIDIMGFLGNGRLTIDFGGATYTGTITIRSVKARVDILNATMNYRSGETKGVVQVYQTDYAYLNNCIIRGKSGTGGTTAVVQAYDSSFLFMDTCEVYNAVTCLIRSSYGATTIVKDVKGSGAPIGLRAEYGGRIGIAGKIPDCALDWEAILGGEIIYQGTPAVDSGTSQTAPTPPTTTSWTSTNGNSWRTRYNSWRNDGTVRQGQWDGYGIHTGIWLFPSSMSSTLTGKTIQKMVLKLTRLSGSGYGSMTAYIRWHSHTSFPSGQPPVSGDYVTATFSQGQTREIVLPSSFHSAFSSGQAKGIGLYISNSSNTYYGAFSKTATLTVTYT